MALDFNKIRELGERVYNGKMIEDKANNISDAEDIKALCKKVFGDGTVTPDPSLLHSFNNVIVQVADRAAKPKVTQMIEVLANMKTANPGDIVLYNIPQVNKVKVVWAALGTGVDLVRIGKKNKIPATPKTFQFGAYYEPLDMAKDSVDAFNEAVNLVAEAKVKLYLDKIAEVVAAAILGGTIPAGNALEGANVSIADYRGLESKLIRYGGRPVFVADTLLIEHFATQLVGDATYKELLTNELRQMFLSDLTLKALSRSVAVTLVNPFTNETNSAVELPVNIGYMFAGGQGNTKPFNVTEFGGMRQLTEQDIEDERIKIKVAQEADITLIAGEALGYVKDSSISL
jgi:hypothetical protein